MSLFSVAYISSRRFARFCVERRGREKVHKMPQKQNKQAQDKYKDKRHDKRADGKQKRERSKSTSSVRTIWHGLDKAFIKAA